MASFCLQAILDVYTWYIDAIVSTYAKRYVLYKWDMISNEEKYVYSCNPSGNEIAGDYRNVDFAFKSDYRNVDCWLR